MNSKLNGLIRDFKTNNGDTYTHVSYFGPKAHYNIPTEELNNFWEKYSHLANNNEMKLCIGEKCGEFMPIVLRFTLKFASEIPEPYGDDYLISLISCFHTIMSQTLNLHEDNEWEYICVVLEPETFYKEDNNHIWQFAIQFPYCKTDISYQTRILRPRVIEMLHEKNVNGKLYAQPLNTWDSIIDRLSCHEPWPLYGSVIHINGSPLKLSMILPYIELDADIEDIDKCDLEDVFDPNKHSHVKNGILSLDTIRQHPIEFWMPLFLSVNYGSNITMVRDGVRKVNIHKTNSKSKTNIFRGMEQGISELEQKKELALTFLSMLNSEVYSNDAYWLDIGRCLYNVCNGSIWGLEEWIRFGDSNGLKHTKYECKTQYYRFRRDSNFLSIKTLAWYARKDAPDLYSKWHSEWCLPIMEEEATTLTDYSVAKAFYRIYWLDYICVYEGRTRMWKVYNNHRWMDDEGGVSIRLELSEGFRKKFLALRTSISDRVLNEHNINNQKYLNEYIDQISRLIRLLEKDRFKSSVMRNLSDLFYDRAFAKAKDCNPYLLGCPNCIIEYIPNKFAIARDGKPEDYITKSTDCHYEKDFSWDHPTVQECHYWMKQVYPDPDLLHYVYKIFSTIPVGKNMEKKIYAHCGEGSNSKSMIKKAFQLALGEYNCDLPIEVLTKEAKDSGSASPEKAQLNAARVAWLDEPEDDEQLRTTWAKKISGGDSFFGRNLGSNGGSIKSSAKIFISCNNIPTWKNGDKAMRDRFIYIPYLAKWVFNAPDSIEEQFKRRLFKRDNNFEDCLIYLAPALLWICVYYYEKYCIEGLKTPPKIVREYTDKYWKENDPYHLYTTSRIETVYLPDQDKIRDRDAKISIPQLYGDFKNWYRFSFGGKEPTLNSFKYQLSQRWGPPGPYGWEGIKFIDSIANI